MLGLRPADMATSGSDLVKDMRHIHEFLDAQKKLVSAETMGKMQDGQAHSFARQLENSRLSLADAAALASTVAEGPWTALQAAMLGERISAAAASGVTERPSRRPLQTVQGFASFLTQKDIDMLEDQGVHSSVKLQCVVSRCVGLGMHLPSEPTVKHIIATCIDLGLQAADSASKYRLLTEFKTQLKSRVKHAPKLPSHLHLVKYPADPLSLPEALRSTAYGHGEEPSNLGGDMGLSTGSVPCRKTSKLVRGDSDLSQQSAAPMMQMQQLMAQMMHHVMMQQSGAPSGAPGASLANLHVFKLNRSNKALRSIAEEPSAQSQASASAQPELQASASSQPELQASTRAQPWLQASTSAQPELQASASAQPAALANPLFDLDVPAKPNNFRPEQQFQIMNEAFDRRSAANRENSGGPAGEDGSKKPAPKGKAKAKAKAKSKAAAKCTPMKVAKPQLKPAAKSTPPKVPGPPKAGEGTFFWKDGKIHRLGCQPAGYAMLRSLGRRKFVSQSALATLLQEVAALPELPSANSRSSIKRCRDEGMDIDTPFGKVLLTHEAQLVPETASSEPEMAQLTSDIVRRLPGKMSEYFKLAMRNFFAPTDIRNGMLIMLPDSERKVLFGDLSIVLGDEAALKDILDMKGASGTLPCPLCRNLVSHRSDLASFDTTGSMVDSTNLDLSLVEFHSDASIRDIMRFLKEKKDSCTKNDFQKTQQFTGWNYNERGALLCQLIDLKPASSLMWDWMHTYVSNGVWNVEVGLLLSKLKAHGLSQQDLHKELQNFVLMLTLCSAD
ncbi:unnamed protein product [Effrenium voratum]|nr:unnamed protein product [Effrenium voratum]